jgi:hypothetical protein
LLIALPAILKAPEVAAAEFDKVKHGNAAKIVCVSSGSNGKQIWKTVPPFIANSLRGCSPMSPVSKAKKDR